MYSRMRSERIGVKPPNAAFISGVVPSLSRTLISPSIRLNELQSDISVLK
jgi:hypothetical protein